MATSSTYNNLTVDKKGKITMGIPTNAQVDASIATELQPYNDTVTAGQQTVDKATQEAYTKKQAATTGSFDTAQQNLNDAYNAEKQRQADYASKLGLTDTGMKQQDKTSEMQTRAIGDLIKNREQELGNIQNQIKLADAESKAAWANMDTAKANMAKARKFELMNTEQNLLLELQKYNLALKKASSGSGSKAKTVLWGTLNTTNLTDADKTYLKQLEDGVNKYNEMTRDQALGLWQDYINGKK